MSEWLKEHAWKACVGEILPRVRIPLSPPVSASRFSSVISAFCSQKRTPSSIEDENRASRDAPGSKILSKSVPSFRVYWRRRARVSLPRLASLGVRRRAATGSLNVKWNQSSLLCSRAARLLSWTACPKPCGRPSRRKWPRGSFSQEPHLDEVERAKRFGVSGTPIREALAPRGDVRGHGRVGGDVCATRGATDDRILEQ